MLTTYRNTNSFANVLLLIILSFGEHVLYLSDTNLMSKVNSELAGIPGNACEP